MSCRVLARCLLVLFAVGSGSTHAATLLIRDVTLVSPERAMPLAHADVFIRDGRIAAISAGSPAPEADAVIEGRGRWLTPGLIDSHVHLGSDAGLREDQAAAHPELAAAFHAQEPRSYLYFGFTHLVDLKQSEDFVRTWRAQPIAPGLSYCKALPFPNGYGEAFLPESVRNQSPYLLDDPDQRALMPTGYDPAAHTVAAVLRQVAQTQATCVKTFYETGFAGLWKWPVPSDALMRDVSLGALSMGLRHAHHANSLAGYRQALAARVDVLAHGLWHWDEFNTEAELPRDIMEVLDGLIAAGIAVQPTHEVLAGELRLFDATFLDDPRLAKVVPPALLAFYRSDEAQWFRRKMEQNLQRTEVVSRFLGHAPSGDPTETSRVALHRLQQIVRYLHQHGGRILLASDTPSSPTWTNPPGLNGMFELQALESTGLSPQACLRAATLANAEAFGLARDIGSVEVGKRADLLLLNADPLISVAAFEAIESVILAGRVLARDSLAAGSSPPANPG